MTMIEAIGIVITVVSIILTLVQMFRSKNKCQ